MALEQTFGEAGRPERTEEILSRLEAAKEEGVTAKDMKGHTVDNDFFPKESFFSSDLSALHKDGVVAKTTEHRDHAAVYVLSDYVNGREVVEYGSTKPDYCQSPECLAIEDKCASMQDELAEIKAQYAALKARYAHAE